MRKSGQGKEAGAGLLTTAEAARRLGITQGAVRVLLNNTPHRMPNARRFGPIWVIPERDVERFKPGRSGRPKGSKPKISR